MSAVKVKVSVPVEVDVEAWCDEYGCDPSEVRADIAVHVRQMVSQQLESLGVGR